MVRIDQLTSPPRIGRSYEVPCLVPTNSFRSISLADFVKVQDEAHWDWLSGIRPIMLPLHEDTALGLPIDHYHIDLRFCAPLRFAAFKVSAMARTGDNSFLGWWQVVDTYTEDQQHLFRLEWLNLNCYRPFPDFAPKAQDPAIYQFLRSFVGSPLECGKCPHQKLHVASLTRTGNHPDRVVCPGHGLLLDLKQNRVVGVMGYPIQTCLILLLTACWTANFVVKIVALQLDLANDYLVQAQRCDRLEMELLDQLLPPPPSGQISRNTELYPVRRGA